MGLRSILAATLKGKVLAVVFVGTAVVGGATAAMASTPAKQFFTNQTAIVAKTATPTDRAANRDEGMGNRGKGTATPEANRQNKDQQSDHSQQCAGLPEIQRLATQFSLSIMTTSDDVKALCSLHDGTFKGTTTGGSAVSTSTVYGYGEIDQLLTAAQLLASHDTNNVGGKLTSDNTRSYLASVLSHCGTTQLEVCLNATPSGHNSNPGSNNNPGSTRGKPTSTPVAKH